VPDFIKSNNRYAAYTGASTPVMTYSRSQPEADIQAWRLLQTAITQKYYINAAR
jgi:hypothetical protein